MALPLKLIAAVTTTAAAASAAAYITMTSRTTAAPGGTSGNQPAQTRTATAGPAAPADDMKLCVGSDRVLYANREGEDGCADGREELHLAWDSDQRVCDLCDPLKDQEAADPASNNAALDAIERRIRDLEKRPYFEVVNGAGQTILKVTGEDVRLFHNGRVAAAVAMTALGAYFSALSPAGAWTTSIGTSGDSAGVIFQDGSATRAELGTRDGPFGLRFPAGNGLIAGIGESRAGTGAAVVGTRSGRVQASMIVSGTRGMVSVIEQPGVGGLTLAESAIGGGLLVLADWTGNSAVKMGHNGHRYGVVLAGPVLGYPLVPRSGLTGSYFMGCASGERPACMPAVSEK